MKLLYVPDVKHVPKPGFFAAKPTPSKKRRPEEEEAMPSVKEDDASSKKFKNPGD